MGYNFSMLNYDTIANGVPGSMNLYWNQAAMHNSVYPSLFMTPNMGNFGFTPYMNYSNNNWLLDPGFALTNAFGQFGMTCPWMNGGGFTTGGGISSAAKTDEEIEAEENRKALEKIINELKTAKILTDADKRKIDNAKKEAKDAGEDLVGQYEAYKAKFDEIISEKDSKIKEELLEKGQSLKLEDGTKIMDARIKLGLGDFTIASSSFEAQNLKTTIEATDDIIKFIEGFQDHEGKQIMEVLCNSNNQAATDENITAVKNKLITKAKSLRRNVDSASRNTFDIAISTLENMTVTSSDSGVTIPTGFERAFNDLYVLTRVTAAMILDDQVAAKYGKHSSVFQQSIFKDTVIEDLECDGYTVDVNMTVESTVIEDSVERSPEEQAIYERDQNLIRENNKKLEDASAGIVAYKSETITVNINGENVSLTKLTPKDGYKNINPDAETYYFNPKTGVITKASASGEFDSSAETMTIEKWGEQFSTYTSTTCLSSFVTNNVFKNTDLNDGFEFTNAYNNEHNNICIAYSKDTTEETENAIRENVFELIDTIKDNIYQDTILDQGVIGRAYNKMKNYYEAVLNELEIYGTGCNGKKGIKKNRDKYKEVALSLSSSSERGARNVETCNAFYFEVCNDNDKEDQRAEADNNDWDYTKDSGITIQVDRDWSNEWSAFIDGHVLVKKFEYYLAQELEALRNS